MNGLTRKWFAAAILLFPVLVIAGCGDDNPSGVANDQAPALPDQQSFSMDNSAFPESQELGDKPSNGLRDIIWEDTGDRDGSGKGTPDVSGAPVADSASYSNYVAGRTVVGVARAAVVAFSAAPASAFAGAFNATPAQQSDGSWTWSYAIVYGSASYNLALNGAPSVDRVDWSMRVTTTGLAQNVTNFLWFSGQTQNGGGAGYWQVYDALQPEAPANLIRVDWSRVSAGSWTATWLNNRVGSYAYGDNLAYSEIAADASVTYTRGSDGDESFVRWNMATTAGSVRLPVYNGGQEACWDASHFNSSCSQ